MVYALSGSSIPQVYDNTVKPFSSYIAQESMKYRTRSGYPAEIAVYSATEVANECLPVWLEISLLIPHITANSFRYALYF